MKKRSPLFWFLVLTSISHTGSAQLVLRGMVADSALVQALPNVNILVKRTGAGVVSDIRGGFLLHASETDTIIFSRVGYFRKIMPATAVNQLVIVFLKEEHRMLRPVEVGDRNLPSWLPEIPAESPWKNSMYDKKLSEIPGFQGIQTFGPGYVFKMPGSGFKRAARAKQRLREVEQENDIARDYIQLVNSPSFKGKIMEQYGLAEDEFYVLLARFNEKNKDFIYRLTPEEVIPLLLQFYADQAKKK